MLSDLIVLLDLCCCTIMTFEAVLVKILDRADASTKLTVDMAVVACREVAVVGDDMPVVIYKPSWCLLVSPTIVASAIDRIRVITNQGLLLVVSRIALGAQSILYAGSIGVSSTTGTMEHAVGDNSIELRLKLWVWEFSTDEVVDVVHTDNLVLRSKEDEEVHVGEAALLKLNDMDMSNSPAKDAFDSDLLEKGLLLHVEDVSNDVWTMGGICVFKKCLQDLWPSGVAGHSEKDVWAQEESHQGHGVLIVLHHVACPTTV